MSNKTKEDVLKENDVSIDRWPDTKELILKSMQEYAEIISKERCIGLNEYCRENYYLGDHEFYQTGHRDTRTYFTAEQLYDKYISETLKQKP